MTGCPVPPHGSGGQTILPRPRTALDYAHDPDETPGRALYRAMAERQARMDTAMRRVVKMSEKED